MELWSSGKRGVGVTTWRYRSMQLWSSEGGQSVCRRKGMEVGTAIVGPDAQTRKHRGRNSGALEVRCWRADVGGMEP